MPRKMLIRSADLPYHVTIRCNNREWFDLPMRRVWEICLYSISRANFKRPVNIEAFVLMANHYHLLLYTPNGDLDKFMQIFNTCLSHFLRIETNRINRIFGDRYKWSLVTEQRYYQNVVRYVFQNPIRAGLVSLCQEYPFSSLHYQIHGKKLPFVTPDRFADISFINYVNQRLDDEQNHQLKTSLQKTGSYSPDAE